MESSSTSISLKRNLEGVDVISANRWVQLYSALQRGMATKNAMLLITFHVLMLQERFAFKVAQI
jgi:hypothetical protein